MLANGAGFVSTGYRCASLRVPTTARCDKAQERNTWAPFILGAGVHRARRRAEFPPGVGAVTLALLLGLFSMIYGVSQITMGAQKRRRMRP